MLDRLTCGAALLIVISATSAFAQPPVLHDKQEKSQSGPSASLSVNARLVNLPVVVRDKKGAFVKNLTKADFALAVDGHPETIRYFDRDNDLPLSLGLLVDTSMSQRKVLDEERTASGAFLEQMLSTPPVTSDKTHPPDQAFVIQFAHETELLQDLTNSKPKLQAAIKQIDTTSSNTQSDPSTTDDSPGHRGSRHGGTTLYDAIFLSSNELMAKQQGRKALVILSDGVDNGSKESLTSSIESAQRADTIIYAIYFKGEEQHQDYGDHDHGGGRRGGIGFPGGGGGYPGGGGGYPGGGGGGRRGGGGGNESHVDGKKILERIAGETGGRLFEVSKKENVASIYNQIAEELRSQYRLGYTPDEATSEAGYHKVNLTIPKQDKLIVQTRDGYYSGK